MSSQIWVPLLSAGVGCVGSWLVIAVTVGRWTGRMETQIDAIKEDMRDMKNDRDLVRWSILGPMLGTLPRVASQEMTQL